ncbi:DUF2140 family protein [Aedoeadaptatus urinae]|uniref:DUF2140 family protein n=1 Tax=Aedoeadaptatus urinae TaxID=1871017 RepID=UPI00097DF610|nr:DUF2140 family protein [Peptoniphilus urinae]
MHNSSWKIAFLLLLAVNIIVLAGLYILSRPKDRPEEEEIEINEKSNYEVSLTKEALESAMREGLERSGSDIRFSVADGFYFRIPVEAYGMRSELVLKTNPIAYKDGTVHMKVERLNLGSLLLPEGAALSLAQAAVDVEGLKLLPAQKEIVLDPNAFMPEHMGTLRAKVLDVKNDRYVFEGNLGAK